MKTCIDKKGFHLFAVLFFSCMILLPAGTMSSVVAGENGTINGASENPEYEQGFFNSIDFNRKTIVINDMVYTFNNQTRFFTSQGASISVNSFRKDSDVEYLADNNQVLKAMKQGKDSSDSDAMSGMAPSADHPSSQQAIRLENGVWTN